MSKEEGKSSVLNERAADLVRQMNPETGVVDLASWEAIRRRMVLPGARARGPEWGTSTWRWLAVPGLAACVLLGFFALRSWRTLGLSVEGGRLADDGEVLNWGRAPSRLHFSDGTLAELAPETRARVAARTRSGARLVLQGGEMSLAVVHTGHATWQVDAGPYEVLVTGTKFQVRWDAPDERFTLRLLEGSVTVKGGLAGEGVRLRAGQRLQTSGAAHWLEILDDGQLSPPPAAPSTSPAARSSTSSGASSPGEAAPAAAHPAHPAGSVAMPSTSSVAESRPSLSDRQHPSLGSSLTPVAHKHQEKVVRLALRSPGGPSVPTGRSLGSLSSSAASPASAAASSSPVSSPASSSAVPSSVPPLPLSASVPQATAPLPRPLPPRVDPSPPPRLMAGGGECNQRAQFQFEDSTEQFAMPGCCSMAFSALSVDKQHSYCGHASLRADASFDLQGRPSYTGYPPRQTGEVKVRINPPQDFTHKTVSMRIFVEAPPGVRFAAVLYVVNNSVYVPGGYTETCSPGHWCTLRHTFEVQNPLASGDYAVVNRVNQLAFQIKSLGNMTAWSGHVYLDDVRWE